MFVAETDRFPMHIEVRKRKTGTVYSIITRTKDGKRLRLKQSQHPLFKSYAEAEKWVNSHEGTLEARKAEALRKQQWKSAYYQYNDLLEQYRGWQKERASNSWDSNSHNLENWVFTFFLQEKNLNNANDWHLYYQEFKDWLAITPKLNRDEPLSMNTQNNVVTSLNTFMTFLKTYNLIDPGNAVKCEAHAKHKLGARDAKYVISVDERDKIYGLLPDGVKDFFWVLYHSGMRFNEAFGLPMSAIFKGEIPKGPLKEELDKYKVHYYGYIYLQSQIDDNYKKRDSQGRIVRKPLKQCRTISPKNSRIIPIRDKKTFNILVGLHKVQQENLIAQKYGLDRDDYLLFDVGWNELTRGLRAAYKQMKWVPKGYHACRHTFITNLVGEFRSYFLVRMISGHRSQSAFEKYLHVFEQIALSVKIEDQELDFVD